MLESHLIHDAQEVMDVKNCAICSFPCHNVFVNNKSDLAWNCFTAYTEESRFFWHLKVDWLRLVRIYGIVQLLHICSASKVMFLCMSKVSVQTQSQLLQDVLERALLFPYMPFCNIPILLRSTEMLFLSSDHIQFLCFIWHFY